MAVNKVVYNGETLIDLTGDTVTEDKLLIGTTAHDKSGNVITGTYEELDISAETADYTSELNTQDAIIDQITAVLESKFVVPSNLQSKSYTPSTSKQTITADAGYDALSSVIVEAIPQSYTNQIYQNGYDAGNEAGYNAGYNEAFELYKPYKQELSYIQSTGTQCIDTEVIPKVNETKIVISNFSVVEHTESWETYFGSDSSDGASDSFRFRRYSDTDILGANWGGASGTYYSNYIHSNYAVGKVLETVEYGPDGLFINGVLESQIETTSPVNGAYSMYLFAGNDGGSIFRPSKIRFSNFQVYQKNVIIRDYIPVLDWDDIPCLYDKVRRKMCYSIGTGNFIAGAVKAA